VESVLRFIPLHVKEELKNLTIIGRRGKTPVNTTLSPTFKGLRSCWKIVAAKKKFEILSDADLYIL